MANREHEGDVRLSGLPEQVLYGVAYYAEYQPYDRLERDLDLMAQAGLTVIRVGESVWSTWEPEDGRFELEWLAPVLDGAHARGIKVILGTPTYAMPPVAGAQVPGGHGRAQDRRAHPLRPPPGRRLLARRVPLARRPGRAPGRRPLRAAPGRDRLPGRQRARAWSSSTTAPRSRASSTRCGPSTTTSPRSTASGASSTGRTGSRAGTSCGRRTATPSPPTTSPGGATSRRSRPTSSPRRPTIVRELARPDQFVTTCMALSRPAFDPRELNRASLDVAAVNPYYPMQDALTMPEAPAGRAEARLDPPLRRVGDPLPGRPHLRGAAAAVPRHRDQRALDRRARTRTSPPSTASGARRRGRSWRAARGWSSTGIGTRSTTATSSTGSACSTTTASPAAATTRSSGSRATSQRAGDAVVGLVPHADVALLYSRESKWAMEFHPPLATDDGRRRPRLLRAHLHPLLRGPVRGRRRGRDHLRAGLRGDRASGADRARASTSPTTRCWTACSPTRRAADTSCSSFRGGYADEEARPRTVTQPARLTEAVGATYDEYTNLTAPVRRERRLQWRRHRLGRRTATHHRRDARCATSIRISDAGRRSPPTSTGRAE